MIYTIKTQKNQCRGDFNRPLLNKYLKKYIIIDEYVIMPNHVHAIIIIGCDGKTCSETERSRPFPTLSTIVGLYKSGVSKRIHIINKEIEVWQKHYYDHIIRNRNDYSEIWKYIDNNPIKWEEDSLYI